jgi:predicted ester cyclase
MPDAQGTDVGSIARGYFEAIAARDTEAMMGFWEPGGIGDIHGLVELRAPDTYGAWFANLFAAVPDFRMEILELVVEGEKAAVRWRSTGTFDGTARFERMLPTGAKIDITGFDLLTIRDGKIQRNDAYLNGNEMAQQLGALPPSGSLQERAMIGALNLKTRLARRLRGR